MKFSYPLLKKLVPGIKDLKSLAEALTFHAFEVEGWEKNMIDVKLYANRYSDAGSHWGLARIVAAILNQKSNIKNQKYEDEIKTPKTELKGTRPNLQIKTKLCQEYIGTHLEIPSVGGAPKTIRDVLADCGLRSINGVVDIMNYVMLEVGQPLHAFDAEKVQGVIEVRLAEKGEKITTIDGNNFTLTEEDLIIADEKGPLAIAGIKGGKRAEVSNSTKKIIVEAANFDSVSVYKTARRLNLTTDASLRFSHGLSPVLADLGMRRAGQLLKEVLNAKVGESMRVANYRPTKRILKFHIDKFQNLTGLMLKESVCLDYLKKLGFGAKGSFVEIPPTRMDISIFEDLVEEIVNLYGYQNLPPEAPHVPLMPSGFEDDIRLKDNVRKILINFGLNEVYNYSFAKKGSVEIANPIAEDKKYLRASLRPLLEKNVEENLKYSAFVRIFEIGRIFESKGEEINENLSLGMATTGKQAFLELKGMVQQMLQMLGLVDYFTKEDGAGLRLESDHHVLGWISAGKNSAFAEIDLTKLSQLVQGEKEYRPLPKYPSVMRDLSLLVSDEQRVGPLQDVLENTSQLVEDVDLIDWYQDEKLGDGKKSLTFRLIFQSAEKTLTDKEVDTEVEKILSALKEKFEIEVR